MAKETGLGAHLSVGGVDVSGDIGALSKIGGGFTTQDVTGIDKSAFERIGLLRDGAMEWSAFFNPAAGAAHSVFSTLPTTDQIMTYHHTGLIGAPAASIVAKQVNYDPTRAADGAITVSGSSLGNGYALEWGTQATAWQRTDTAATNGAAVDFTATTAFGLSAHLQVYSVVGTSMTATLEHSDDSAGVDPWAAVTAGAFAAATSGGSPQAQRIQTARTESVKRWIRVVTSGTFSSAVFSVQVTKPATAVAY